MIEWTESARRVLNDYCLRSKECVAASGADADEVSEDLRRHVEEEVRSARIGVVTEADIRRILAKVGEPQAAPTEPTNGRTHSARSKPDDDLNHFGGFLLVSSGVALPIIALLFE